MFNWSIPLPFRSDISGEGKQWTPLHYACYWRGQVAIAKFLIEQEKRRIEAVPKEGRGRETPSYNMQDNTGRSPAFWTYSSTIVEMLLPLEGFWVIQGNGKPLLYECAISGMVSDKIAQDEKLTGQYVVRYPESQPRLPLEAGSILYWYGHGQQIPHSDDISPLSALQGGHISSSVQLIKALERNSPEAKMTNLKALVAIVATCYDVLSKVLESTHGIISIWLKDNRVALTQESNYFHFLALTMKAEGNKDWFQPYDKGEFASSMDFTAEG